MNDSAPNDKTSPPYVRLPDSEWALWPTAMVRGAGFPAHLVQRLADEELAALADRAADGRDSSAVEEYRISWQTAAERFGQELGEVARSDGFQLAVGWQNRRFLDTAVEPLLRQLENGKPGNSKRRTREQAVATYWQRYCLKNESIGFFGPTAWATLGTDPSTVTVAPGASLTDRATVYLERWPVDVLARKLATDFDLRPWLRPRRSPLLRIVAEGAQLAGGTVVPADSATLALLRVADGTVTARDIARRLIADPDSPLAAEREVFDRLGELRSRRWLIWRLELPTSLTAEEDLLALVDSIDDDAIRHAAGGQVRCLVEGRARLQRIWDRPRELRAELSRLEEAFAALTGVPGTRNDGQAYGGRTLAYLECRRDVSVRLGTAFIDALRPLSPVLDSIRWLTWRIREEIEPQVAAAYRAARDVIGAEADVDVATLWVRCALLIGKGLNGAVRDAIAEFHTRWAEVLQYGQDETQVSRTVAELETRIKEHFDAPSSGWSQARLACPDVMVAADGPDALAAGRFTVVLGEVHAALNSLDYISMVPNHPDAAALTASLNATFPGPRLMPVLPTESRPKFTVRSHPALIRDADQRLALMPHTPLPHSGTVRSAADVMVRERDSRLLVVTPDGTEFDVLDLFAEAMKAIMLEHFDLFPIDRHRPRVTVDGAVLAREGWRVPLSDLGFAHATDAAERFAAARAWARAKGLPRYAFVKSPVETKPFYVDFASPVYVELLASCVRRTARESAPESEPTLKIVEMLPGPHQTWLTDKNGDRYTSELRFAAYDRANASSAVKVSSRNDL
jgi:hypothetical protein